MLFSIPIRSAARALMAAVAVVSSPLAGAEAPEYQVKAKLLLVLGNYVVWPQAAPGKPAPPLVLGVLGSSPIQGYLEELAHWTRGRPVQIRSLDFNKPATIGECNMLFICQTESERLPRLLALCKGRPIFTVADSAGFGRRGVMLNLLLDGGSMQLEVNLKAIREAGLEISSVLLALPKDKARIVEGP